MVCESVLRCCPTCQNNLSWAETAASMQVRLQVSLVKTWRLSKQRRCWCQKRASQAFQGQQV